jgi:hypothetical protein
VGRYAQLPLSFEPNLGQTDPRVAFVARSTDYNVFLTASEAVIAGKSSVVRMKLAGARSSRPVPLERQTGISAYFIGNDPASWLPEVPHYGRVQYRSVYPGIDVTYYGNGAQLEYDFIIEPGADPGLIRMTYDGADRLRVNDSGDLVLTTQSGDLRLRKPRVYQLIDEEQVEVATAYRLNGREVSFDVAAYDSSRELVIDPVFLYSLTLADKTSIAGVAVDSQGATYITGATSSLNFPTTNGLSSAGRTGNSFAFITKLNPYPGSGTPTIAYSTYLGGNAADSGNDIAVDSAGAAYIAGTTSSSNFPMLHAYQSSFSTKSTSGFITKLNAYSGAGPITLAYSTYFGGDFSSVPRIALDSTGAAYILCYGTGFPVVNNGLSVPRNPADSPAFVARLNPYTGTGNVSVGYSASVGDNAGALALDASGGLYLAGTSGLGYGFCASDDPVPFVIKLNPFTGGPVTQAYTYCKYLDYFATSIAVDGTGAAYLAGNGFGLPYTNAYLTKINPYSGTGSPTEGFSINLGGPGATTISQVAVDSDGMIYLTGTTTSVNFPVLDPAPAASPGSNSPFVAKVKQSNGQPTLAYSTLLAGFGAPGGMAVDSTHIMHLGAGGVITALSVPTIVRTPVDVVISSPTVASLASGQGLVPGQPVALRATFASVTGPPVTGNVTFLGAYTNTILCTATIAGGVASCTTPAGSAEFLDILDRQGYLVTIAYSGDSTYTLGNVTTLYFSFGQTPSTTTLSMSPVLFGTSSSLAATVSLAPYGSFVSELATVTFTQNGGSIYGCTQLYPPSSVVCDSCPLVMQFSLICPVDLLPGANIFGASYSGDYWTAKSTSAPLRVIGGAAGSSSDPASGSGSTQNFAFTFSDTNGWQQLTVVNVLINSVLDGRHACYIAYVPSSANSGSLYLVDDAGDAGGPFSGISLPGSGTIGNSQCSISGAGSSVDASGNTLTLSLAVTFKAAFTGNQVLYLAARDAATNSGWQPVGTWNVPGTPAAGPAVSSMSPARPLFLNQPYTFIFTDSHGWQDLSTVNVLVNTGINGAGACYMAFVPSSAGAGSLFLVDDAGDAAGPYPGMTLPGSLNVSNSQCAISGTGSSVSASGNTLTLKLAITFTAGLGNEIFYLAARSLTLSSGWQAVGSVSIP